MKPYYEHGGITIYHGDAKDVLPLIPTATANVVVTDPPYGVEWQSNRRIEKHAKIANDENLSWTGNVFEEAFRILLPDSLMCSFYGWPDVEIFMAAWKAAGFVPKSHLVWVKSNIGLGWFTRNQHEVAYLLSKGNPEKPERAISDVIYADGTGNKLHPTQKPVELMTSILRPFCPINGIVLDPFMGSGTTLRAAKDLGLKAIGIELEEKYCEIAARRLEQEVFNFE